MDDQGAEAAVRQRVRDDDNAVPKPESDIGAETRVWASAPGRRAGGEPVMPPNFDWWCEVAASGAESLDDGSHQGEGGAKEAGEWRGVAWRYSRRAGTSDPASKPRFSWERQDSRIRAVSRGRMPESIIRSPFACDKFVDSANSARCSGVRKCPRSPVSDTAVRSGLTTCMFIDVA